MEQSVKRFQYTQSVIDGGKYSIEYTYINQVMEDRASGIWIATDKVLYFTSTSTGNLSVINYRFKEDGLEV